MKTLNKIVSAAAFLTSATSFADEAKPTDCSYTFKRNIFVARLNENHTVTPTYIGDVFFEVKEGSKALCFRFVASPDTPVKLEPGTETCHDYSQIPAPQYPPTQPYALLPNGNKVPYPAITSEDTKKIYDELSRGVELCRKTNGKVGLAKSLGL